jgi:hypothetical protein
MNSAQSRWIKLTIAQDSCDKDELTARLMQWNMLGWQETEKDYDIYFL